MDKVVFLLGHGRDHDFKARVYTRLQEQFQIEVVQAVMSLDGPESLIKLCKDNSCTAIVIYPSTIEDHTKLSEFSDKLRDAKVQIVWVRTTQDRFRATASDLVVQFSAGNSDLIKALQSLQTPLS